VRDHPAGEERHVGASSPWKGISGVHGPKCGEGRRRFSHRREREAKGRGKVLAVCLKERKEGGRGAAAMGGTLLNGVVGGGGKGAGRWEAATW
jgi:hypothetical protein